MLRLDISLFSWHLCKWDWSDYSLRCQGVRNVLRRQQMGVAIAERRGARRQKLEGSQEDRKTEGFAVINLSMAIDNHTLNEFMRSTYTRAVVAIIAYIASPHRVHHHNRINIGIERNELCILWLINLPMTKKLFDQRLPNLLTTYIFLLYILRKRQYLKKKEGNKTRNFI